MALISPADTPPPPSVLDVAYKEWAGICRALGSGRQTILLRKGGVLESPSGFRPEYSAFWLYPTHLHETQQGLREPETDDSPRFPEGHIDLELLAAVETATWLDRKEGLEALQPFHAWTEATVQSRFDYRTPGLWVLSVRVYRHAPAWPIEVTPHHMGCKTWVTLDEPLPVYPIHPVLSEDEAATRRQTLALALSSVASETN